MCNHFPSNGRSFFNWSFTFLPFHGNAFPRKSRNSIPIKRKAMRNCSMAEEITLETRLADRYFIISRHPAMRATPTIIPNIIPEIKPIFPFLASVVTLKRKRRRRWNERNDSWGNGRGRGERIKCGTAIVNKTDGLLLLLVYDDRRGRVKRTLFDRHAMIRREERGAGAGAAEEDMIFGCMSSRWVD